MVNWSKVTIEKVTSMLGDGLHGTPKYSDDGEYAFVNGNNLVNGKIVIKKDTKRVDETQYIKYKKPLSERTLMVSINGTLGNIGEYNGEKIILGKSACYFNVIESVNKNYIKYVVSSPYFKEYLERNATGTTIKNISLKQMREYEFLLPERRIQDRISEILGAIDKRIEVNEKINDNLEQQIEALLTAFINEDGTTPVKLGDYLYIKGRIGWKGLKKSEYLPQSNYRIINGETLTKSGIDWNNAGYISEERYLESPEIMLNVGDILLSKDGTIGKIGYVDILDLPTSVASGIFVIRNNKPNIISTTFIYYLLRSKLFEAFIAARTEGSVIPHLYQKDFMEFEFSLPAPDRMTEFEKIAEPMFSQIIGNLNENKVLASLRDSLLPKFMTGELDVSELNI